MIVIILGKRGAGKSTYANYLKENNSFIHYEMSSIIGELKAKSKFKDFKLREFVDEMHSSKSTDFAVKYLYQNNYLEKSNIVITGIRNPSEIEYINSINVDANLVTIYLYTNIIIRFYRTFKRENGYSILDFLIEEYYSYKWNNSKLKENANFIINNNYKFKFNKLIELINSKGYNVK